MAHFGFELEHYSRRNGDSIVRKAAYNSRSRMVDERTGKIHDWTSYGPHAEHYILAPSRAPDEMRDKDTLWNEAEAAEKRRDARTGWGLMLPFLHQLDYQQNKTALDGFLKNELVDRHKYVVQVDIHPPDPDGDHRNWHAHALITPRGCTRNGFLPKKNREIHTTKGIKGLREKWANYQNTELERAGRDERVDHRTYQERGMDKEPGQKMGAAATSMERRGKKSRIGESNHAVQERNQKRADRDHQKAALDRAIQAEKARLTKEATEKEKQQQDIWDRDHDHRQKEEALIAAAIKHDTEKQQAAKQEAKTLSAARAVSEHALKKLDLEREFEADQQREKDILNVQIEANYQRKETVAELNTARQALERSNTFWGRLFGRYDQAQIHVNELQLNLGNIDQRIAEQQGALEARQKSERAAFYGYTDEELNIPEPQPPPTERRPSTRLQNDLQYEPPRAEPRPPALQPDFSRSTEPETQSVLDTAEAERQAQLQALEAQFAQARELDDNMDLERD